MNWHRAIDPAQLGSARIDPSESFPVGHIGTWHLTITIGDHGIDDGGAIFVARRLVTDAPRWQSDRPAALGYCSATTNSSAQLILSYASHHGFRPWRDGLVVRVVDGFLSPGDQVVITLGDRSHGSPGAMLQSYPERQMRLQVFVDAFAGGEYYPLPESPALTVVPGEPSHLEVILPSHARPGDDVPMSIRVSDRWFNPVDHLDAAVEITSDVPLRGLPLRAVAAVGVQQVGTFRPSEPGVMRIQARIGALQATSNPCVVDDAVGALFWADMHGQTEGTIGTGSLAEYFSFARDKALLDVTAWQGNDFQVTDALWDEVRSETRAFNQPGRFVTFLGYEWSGLTPAGGDHNILFRTDDGCFHRSSHWQVYDGSDPSTDRYPIRSLWTELRQRDDVLAIPHVGGRYADLAQSDPNLCPLVEIHSHHGTFEWLAADAFRNDLVVGFCAQSDDHFGRPGFTGPSILTDGDFVSFNVFGGLTAIRASELTREEIWNALWARHCYATS
ncbi:MAG TPA: DUF3604 domain-containing protein, partial [Chloroflexota bacterium]|nr:DUF3604 domain-containing protein [Chloroflexota bacterium]